MHTSHTDGTATVAQMAEAAFTAGMRQILYTEHVRHTSAYYPSFVAEVRAQGTERLEINVGIETKILDLDGSLDCSPLIASLVEGIVGSVHNPPLVDGHGTTGSWSGMDPEAAAEFEFQLAMSIITRSQAHILGHPMGIAVTRFNLRPLDRLYALACACRDYDKAFELNPRYCSSPGDWVGLVRRAGCKVSFGSDAHKTADVGRAWHLFNSCQGVDR